MASLKRAKNTQKQQISVQNYLKTSKNLAKSLKIAIETRDFRDHWNSAVPLVMPLQLLVSVNRPGELKCQ